MSYDKRQQPAARSYVYQGRNGYHYADQKRPAEGSGSYGTVSVSSSAKSAREVASALNEAFAAGEAYGRMLAVNEIATGTS